MESYTYLFTQKFWKILLCLGIGTVYAGAVDTVRNVNEQALKTPELVGASTACGIYAANMWLSHEKNSKQDSETRAGALKISGWLEKYNARQLKEIEDFTKTFKNYGNFSFEGDYKLKKFGQQAYLMSNFALSPQHLVDYTSTVSELQVSVKNEDKKFDELATMKGRIVGLSGSDGGLYKKLRHWVYVNTNEVVFECGDIIGESYATYIKDNEHKFNKITFSIH